MYDLRAVKDAAVGVWPLIINRVAGIPDDFLTAKHGPCPRCGGTDRWRVFNDFPQTGGAICNQCGKFGDGLEVVKWSLNITLPEAIAKVGEFLGVAKSGKKNGNGLAEKADPAKDLEWIPWNESLVNLWCLKKKPITARAVQLIGGRMARYRKKYSVIAIPAIGKDGITPAGWSLYEIGGQKLPKFGKRGEPPEMVKVKATYGSEAGLMGYWPEKREVVWKTEGPSDLLALLSLDLPEGHCAVCNLFGAGENPTGDSGKKTWMLERFKDSKTFVVHDCDTPGQEGATWVSQGTRRRPGWATAISKYATECRNVVLPYEIQPSHGKDLRDWIAEQLGKGLDRRQVYQALLEMADWSPMAEVGDDMPGGDNTGSEGVVEDDDDPYRLARANLDEYASKVGGTLKYWKEEFWRYKGGVYKSMSASEFEAKLGMWIKKEFDRLYLEAIKRGDEIKYVKKVTTNIVKNTVAATKAMTTVPESVEMPCWLENRTSPHWVSMRNGILDLEAIFAGKEVEECLRPHSPQWFSSFRLDYDFDLNAECPRWLKYLEVVMEGDQERISILQEWCGYLLTSTNFLQKFMCFEGEGGNGKTVFFAVINAMLGRDNVSNVSLAKFSDQFGLWGTLGKAVNIDADVGHLDQVSEENLKKFTGGDVMSIERKFLTSINVVPTAKLMLAWNNRPPIRDTSSGPWRRMILIPFNYTIQASERVLGMDQSEWWTKSGEIAGILNWAICGLSRLLRQGGFTESKISEEVLGDYRRESNPVSDFLDENFEISNDEDSFIQSSAIFKAYLKWCEENGNRILSNRVFFREFKRKFKNVKKKREAAGIVRAWGYSGIRFSSSEFV